MSGNVRFDYDMPHYTLAEAAKASGWNLNTLRAVHPGKGAGRGISRMLSLRDVLGIAVANRLWLRGVAPPEAFAAGWEFAHVAQDDRRDPATVYDVEREGFTVLVYHRGQQESKVVPLPKNGGGLGFLDLFVSPAGLRESAADVILLNFVEKDVFMTINPRVIVEGGDEDDEAAA